MRYPTSEYLPLSLLRLSALALSAVAFAAAAQAPQAAAPNPQGGWRKFGDVRADEPAPSPVPPATPQSSDAQAPAAAPPPAALQSATPPAAAPQSVNPGGPLTLASGSWVSIRTNQFLSSDQNRPGDVFTGTLEQPLIANGVVVARRGQTVGGRVVDVVKAGKVRGTSQMAIELTEVSLADGQQMRVRTQLVEFSGGTSRGRDATAIGATTGVGAAIGAAASGGFGAGMGAIAGAAASTIGVLVTRGRNTVVDPEALLTFRLLDAVSINTERSGSAFQPVRQEDYQQNRLRESDIGRSLVVRPPARYFAGPGFYDPLWFGYGPMYSFGWGFAPRYFYGGPRFYSFGGGWGGWGRGWGGGWGGGRWGGGGFRGRR